MINLTLFWLTSPWQNCFSLTFRLGLFLLVLCYFMTRAWEIAEKVTLNLPPLSFFFSCFYAREARDGVIRLVSSLWRKLWITSLGVLCGSPPTMAAESSPLDISSALVYKTEMLSSYGRRPFPTIFWKRKHDTCLFCKSWVKNTAKQWILQWHEDSVVLGNSIIWRLRRVQLSRQ